MRFRGLLCPPMRGKIGLGLCPPMRRKPGSVLSIEDLAILANLADELRSILEKELGRRAAKDKVSWDGIRSDIKCHRIKLETEVLHSLLTPPHTLAREMFGVKDMAAKIMEQIRQRSKPNENPAPD